MVECANDQPLNPFYRRNMEQSEIIDLEISLEDLIKYVESKKRDGCTSFVISGSDFGVCVSYITPEAPKDCK